MYCFFYKTFEIDIYRLVCRLYEKQIRLNNPFIEPFQQYGANLLCPPGLNLNSPQGPLPHFVINISKEDLERILKYVRKNPEGFRKSLLGRKLLRLASQ